MASWVSLNMPCDDHRTSLSPNLFTAASTLGPWNGMDANQSHDAVTARVTIHAGEIGGEYHENDRQEHFLITTANTIY